MKVLGATLGQEFPQISFLPKEKYSFWNGKVGTLFLIIF
jgi:hypothetical protein